MMLLDPTKLLATIRDSLRCQLLAKLSVDLTDKQARDIAANIAMAVMGLEVDETHVIDAPELIDTRTLLTQRKRHHDRCMSPGDDGHLACPVVAGRDG